MPNALEGTEADKPRVDALAICGSFAQSLGTGLEARRRAGPYPTPPQASMTPLCNLFSRTRETNLGTIGL